MFTGKRFLALGLLLFVLGIEAAQGHAQGQTPKANTPAAKPTIVIVHGAWGGAWGFRHVDELLRGKGYNVYRPTLTGLGERVHLASPDVGLTTHINDVVNMIL